MSEWIVDTTRYEESYPLTGREQVATLFGCDLVGELVRCHDCVSCYRDESGLWCCLYGTGFYRRPRDEGDYCSKGKRSDE